MRIHAFYVSGGIKDRPMPVNLIINKSGIKIEFMQQIPYEDIIEVQTTYDVKDKQLSAGKAVVGGLVFGGLGAIAGASLGGKKVESTLRILYKIEDEQRTMVLETKLADVVKRSIEKQMATASETHKGNQSNVIVRYLKWLYGPYIKLLKK